MNGEKFVALLEEMMDLKLQQKTEAKLQSNAEVVRLMQEKRVADKRRLEQIRLELARLLNG